MKKFRAIISLMLTMLLIFQLSVISFAGVDNNCKLAVMETYRFFEQEDFVDVNNVTRINNNTITYDLLWDNQSINSHVIQRDLENGSIEFEVQEGELRNIVTISESGQIFLDGVEVLASSMLKQKEDVDTQKSIAPRLGTVEYSSSPFYGRYSDYSEFSIEHEYSVRAGEKIADATVGALALVLGVLGSSIGVGISLAAICISIRAAFQNSNPRGETIYYTISSYENPDAPTGGMVFYHKQVIKWYTDSNYSKEAVSGRETNFVKTTIRDV